jgi:hypothetical protein
MLLTGLEPHITLTQPSVPKAWGQYCRTLSWGSSSEIKLRPSIILGTNPQVRSGAEYALGRLLLAKDIILHEQVH